MELIADSAYLYKVLVPVFTEAHSQLLHEFDPILAEFKIFNFDFDVCLPLPPFSQYDKIKFAVVLHISFKLFSKTCILTNVIL